MKILAQCLVGSRLYGLQTDDSDYDYVTIYRREIQEYLTISTYHDSLPDATNEFIGLKFNYKRWDVKKVCALAVKNSFWVYELIYSMRGNFGVDAASDVLFDGLRVENFNKRTLAFHCINLIINHRQCGYTKAFSFLLLKHLVQNGYPASLNWVDLLGSVELTKEEYDHCYWLLWQKTLGKNDLPFTLEVADDIEKLPNTQSKVDYTELFRRVVVA